MAEPVFRIVPHGGSDYAAAVALRYEILRKPLGLLFAPEELEQEKDFIHVCGFLDNAFCATAMLTPHEAAVLQVKRVAVKDGLRGKGIGAALMQYCEAYALQQGFSALYCHARCTAVPFYVKGGWVPEGEVFIQSTIPHQKMRKVLRTA